MDRPGQNCDTREHEQKEGRDVSMFFERHIERENRYNRILSIIKCFKKQLTIEFCLKELYDKWMKMLIKACVLTTETVCQLFLSLIMIVEHLAIWNEGTIFSKLYILPQINTVCVILEKLTKLIIHVYLELSAQSQYHSFFKKYDIA